MLKGRVLLRLVLLGALVIATCALASTPASAQGRPPWFGLCVKKVAGESIAPYENESRCLSDVEKAGGDTNRSWAHAYASGPGRVLICVKKEPATYVEALCKTGGAGGEWGIETAVLVAPGLVGRSIGFSQLSGKAFGVTNSISCSTNALTIEPEGTGKQSGGKIEYTGCSVSAPSGCSVKQPIDAEFDGQLEEQAGKFVDKFTGTKSTATTKEIFMELEFYSSSAKACAIGSVKATVTGSQTCEFDSEITMMKKEHEVLCKPSGSNLKFGGVSAFYAGTDKIEGSEKEALEDVETEM